MSPDSIETVQPRKRPSYRADEAGLALPMPALEACFAPLILALAGLFVLVGAASRDLGSEDALVGLAAGDTMGPLGQVYGSWRPELWPARVAVCALTSRLVEDGRSWPGSVLWPGALAAAAIGWLMAHRLASRASVGAGLLFGLTWFGCVGVIDHSGGSGLDFLSGLAIVGALDRLMRKGSDTVAGLWCSAALLLGGWPPLAIVLLAVIVLGRAEANFSWRLLLPSGLALAGWTAWTLGAASPEALAAGLVYPFTEKPDWTLALRVMALGLPFAPVALPGLLRSGRASWPDSTRNFVIGWVQVCLACLIAGTIVPGLAGAARVPALAGILIVAAVTLDSAASRRIAGRGRKWFLGLTFGIAACWLMLVLYGETFCLVVAPFYRTVGIVVLVLSGAAATLGWQALRRSNTRRAVVTLALVAVALKLGHWGVFVPEWNYRVGQGPWGRAIGQWLLPNWPIYTLHPWPTELGFAIGNPIRQLSTPRHLSYHCEGGQSQHVLLLESQFEHWPDDAPSLRKVAEFQDRSGARRILARTEGLLLTPSGAIFPDKEIAPRPRAE
ncbi:MAG: hypothetical protein U0790_13925 [Isosphaeraceae bacterium]